MDAVLYNGVFVHYKLFVLKKITIIKIIFLVGLLATIWVLFSVVMKLIIPLLMIGGIYLGFKYVKRNTQWLD